MTSTSLMTSPVELAAVNGRRSRSTTKADPGLGIAIGLFLAVLIADMVVIALAARDASTVAAAVLTTT